MLYLSEGKPIAVHGGREPIVAIPTTAGYERGGTAAAKCRTKAGGNMAAGTGPNKTARVATLCSVAALGTLGFGAAVAAQGDDGLNVTAQAGNG